MFARHAALKLISCISAEHSSLGSVTALMQEIGCTGAPKETSCARTSTVPGSSSAISGLRDNSVADLSGISGVEGHLFFGVTGWRVFGFGASVLGQSCLSEQFLQLETALQLKGTHQHCCVFPCVVSKSYPLFFLICPAAFGICNEGRDRRLAT